MAVPFRRTSKTKKRMRRTHLKLTAANVFSCPNCGEPIKAHRACTKCGFYKGKNVLVKESEVVEESPKKATKATKEVEVETEKKETKKTTTKKTSSKKESTKKETK